MRADRAWDWRTQLVARSDGWCEAPEGWCPGVSGRHPATDAHHVVKRSTGGAWTVENGLMLCRAGHAKIDTHIPEARALGLLRYSWEA